jgi:hypothetical protein
MESLSPGLLATCKQVYCEAASILYAQRIVFADSAAFVSFAGQLSPMAAKALRHLEIRCWTSTRSRKSMGYLGMSMLAAKGAVNLERFSLNCSLGYFDSYSYRRRVKDDSIPKRIARKVYRDCYPWLDAVAAHRLDDGETGNMDEMYAGIETIMVGKANFQGWVDDTARTTHLEEEARFEAGLEVCRQELRRLVWRGLQ